MAHEDETGAGGEPARAFIDALHRLEHEGDVEAIVPLFAEDAELSNPTDARPHRGAEGARRFWRAYRDSFRDIDSRFRHVVEGDDAAILEWRSRGHLATGGEIEYDGVSVLEFDGDRIRRFRAYFDPASLTVEEQPGQAAGG